MDITRPVRLDVTSIEQALAGLPGWKIRDDKLHREFTFNDFYQAWEFMCRVADGGEDMNHHPERFCVTAWKETQADLIIEKFKLRKDEEPTKQMIAPPKLSAEARAKIDVIKKRIDAVLAASPKDYSTVSVDLVTWYASGITDFDIRLARMMSDLVVRD